MFNSLFQEYVYVSRYSRYLHDQKRRETWPETVARYFDFFTEHLKDRCGYALPAELRAECESAVLNLDVMPSMRCLMSAGTALQRDEMAGFNCSYLTVDSPRCFAEALYILMVGTGVGFSVERQYICKLPEVPDALYPSDTVIVVADSKIGWAKALNELISILFTGYVPKIDVSKVRPAGAILKTFGGRASGPDPLMKLLNFTINTFKAAVGRKLTSIECHDLVCMVGDSVVVGGVRRSALISLSNLSDDRMRSAKSGQWWVLTPWRRLANNSAVYTDKQPSMDVYMNEWKSLYESKSGERGIFSRYATTNVIKRSNAFRHKMHLEQGSLEFACAMRLREIEGFEFGCNPCSEIILRDKEVCNLSESVIRPTDTLEDVLRKVRIMTILGTWQSTLVDYRFLSRKWSQNSIDERLLGTSLTGVMDHPVLSGRRGRDLLIMWLTKMREVYLWTNFEMSQALGIPMCTAGTCMKPSGTVSSLVNSASGIHGRHGKWYLRNARADIKDPCSALMIDAGIPWAPDVTSPHSTLVFSFPQQSSEESVLRSDMSATEQLDIWLIYQMFWCEHKPSVTVSVKEHEWMRVGSWVYDNFEWMSGVSFLPYSDHIYEQAPYQELTEDEYKTAMAKMPEKVDWTKLSAYENTDLTVGSQTLACSSAEGCDL